MKDNQNIKIVLQYDGTRYDGWQKQGNTDKTIQAKLEAVLHKMVGQPVEVFGSGRTDAGVHALAQVANFHIPSYLLSQDQPDKAESVLQYLNRYLPEDIRVLSAARVCPRFHSRLSAVEKEYQYCIDTGIKADVFDRKYVYTLGRELDVAAMKEGAKRLLGTRDFKSFCSLKRMKKSTVRTLSEIRIEREGTRVILTYRGNGFLHHMVRILTGTLIEVGLGERQPRQMEEVLLALDRRAAGFTAPAQALFLQRVSYENLGD